MRTFQADRIRKKRLRQKMTQQELADAVGLSREHIAVIESGKSIPKVSTLLKIAEALRCRVGYFFVNNGRYN
jgi:transcriptional regulator with XRE-family HTH domain